MIDFRSIFIDSTVNPIIYCNYSVFMFMKIDRKSISLMVPVNLNQTDRFELFKEEPPLTEGATQCTAPPTASCRLQFRLVTYRLLVTNLQPRCSNDAILAGG